MGSKKDREEVLEHYKGVWVYEGERRPVVVEAKNERHATDKIRKSPHYDGFPIKAWPLAKFLEKCSPKEEVPVPVEPPKKADDSHVFIAVKALGGLINSVKVYSDEKTAKTDADKIADHLNHESDDLRIFSLENHKEIGEGEFMEAKEIYSVTMPGEIKVVEDYDDSGDSHDKENV